MTSAGILAYTALETAVLREDHDLTSQEAPVTAPALGEADAACCPVNRQVGDLLLGPIKHVVGTADEVEADNYWCVPPALSGLLRGDCDKGAVLPHDEFPDGAATARSEHRRSAGGEVDRPHLLRTRVTLINLGVVLFPQVAAAGPHSARVRTWLSHEHYHAPALLVPRNLLRRARQLAKWLGRQMRTLYVSDGNTGHHPVIVR